MDHNRILRKMEVLFFGAVVPDKAPENKTLGFVRSGNNAQLGILEGLAGAGISVTAVSGQPMAAFPRLKRLWCPYKQFPVENGVAIETIPGPNLLFIREFFRGLWSFVRILQWSRKHPKVPRAVLVYNIYTPPLPFVYYACRLAGAPLIPVTFDLGLPPADFGWLRNRIYHYVEAVAKYYLPKCRGRIVITKQMGIDYSGGKGFLLVEGGITQAVVEQSKALGSYRPRADGVFRLVCAGSLWSGNGIRLLLDAMKKISDPDVELCFAGAGELVPEIDTAAAKDSRIKYAGVLPVKDLFALYQTADLLLNIRLTQGVDMPYLFPSKVLECLSTGIPVLSTRIVDGMDEYNGICYLLQTETAESLAAQILRIKGVSGAHRMEIGRIAQKMIFEEKTWSAQAKRIACYLAGCVDDMDRSEKR